MLLISIRINYPYLELLGEQDPFLFLEKWRECGDY